MNKVHHEDIGCGCGTDCEIDAFTRNNFFTGKLLLERDFTDEQRYMIDKLRHHNRHLHGWGVACGLKVVQHEQDGCRDRFVCVEPGSAVDCCGHDILVVDRECFDITTFPAVRKLSLPNADATSHTLQICVRYTECGTEPIPVLYDECGCDDTRCLPNRILESFDIDVLVDPPVTTETWSGPTLVRDSDIGIAGATSVRVNPADGLLYVLAGTFVHAVDPATRTTLRSHDLGSTVYTFDVAPTGANLYVVRDDGNAGLTLTVLRASDFAANDLAVPNGQAPAVAAVSPAADARYVVMIVPTGELLVYGPDLESAAPSAPVSIVMSKDRELLTVSSDGTQAFLAVKGTAAGQPEVIEAADLTSLAITTLTLAAGTQPAAIQAIADGTNRYLVVADNAQQIVVVDVDAATIAGPATLAGSALDLDGAPWSWALESSGGMSRLQAVNVSRITGGLPEPVGPVVSFVGDSHGVTVSPSGKTLFVPYSGGAGDPGGIAVFDI